jgi:hypothetical protein
MFTLKRVNSSSAPEFEYSYKNKFEHKTAQKLILIFRDQKAKFNKNWVKN